MLRIRVRRKRSKALSVKMDEAVFRDAERFARKRGTSRNAYINDAVRFMSRLHERRLLTERYRIDAQASRATGEEVMRELESFLDEGL